MEPRGSSCCGSDRRARHTGVRAPIVAKRPGNAGGAKGAQGGGNDDEQNDGSKTCGSAREGYASMRDTNPVGMGRTERMDGADVDGTGKRSEGREVVQSDRQSVCDGELASRLRKSEVETRGSRSRTRDDREI